MPTLFKKRFKECHSLAYDMERKNLSTVKLHRGGRRTKPDEFRESQVLQ